MTLLEIKDERALLFAKNNEILELAKTEKRTTNETEKAEVLANLARMKDLDLEKANMGLSDDSGELVRSFSINHKLAEPKFSMMRAIRDRVEGRGFDNAAKDTFIMGRNEFRKSGINTGGEIILPSYLEKRADELIVGSATHGQEIVAEGKSAILPPLVDKLVFSKAGATYLSGLVGNVSIPAYGGTTVGWKTEIAAADQGTPHFEEVVFSPRRLTGYIDVSKLFLAQDGVGAERMLLDNIANAVARALEKTILGIVDGDATQPEGIGFGIVGAAILTTALGTITYAALVGLESTVDAANALDGNLAYITNSTGRGLLKTTDKGVTNDTGDYLCSEDNFVNGYPLLVTNSITAIYGAGAANGNMVVFANWRDLCIAQWGGYDITVDPYTLAASNMVRIVINSYFDAKGLRGGTTTDYDHSFAALSIKA
jgi:HK97 family phage major capsid protein